jgi:hypothetical protein
MYLRGILFMRKTKYIFKELLASTNPACRQAGSPPGHLKQGFQNSLPIPDFKYFSLCLALILSGTFSE